MSTDCSCRRRSDASDGAGPGTRLGHDQVDVLRLHPSLVDLPNILLLPQAGPPTTRSSEGKPLRSSSRARRARGILIIGAEKQD